MRIGLITYDFHPPIGGMGLVAYRYFIALGHARDVHVLAVSSRCNNIENHLRLPVMGGMGLGPILFSLVAGWRINRIISTNGLDLLQVHGGPGGVFLVRKPKVPVVYVAHHTYAQQRKYVGKLIHRLMFRLERRSYRVARRIISVSTTTRESLIEDYGVEPDKVIVVPNGIDTSVFKPLDVEEIPYSTLFVGRLCERKNLPRLFEAIGIVRRAVPGVRLYLVGDGELRKELEGLVREKGFSDNVSFLGKVSESDLVYWYNRASVFVLPSLFEGFGIVCLEAMACGTPVVATRVPGVVDIIDDGETGILVPDGAEEMAGAITELLREPELRSTLAAKGRQKALEGFDWGRVTGKMVEICRDVYQEEQICR